MPTKYIVILGSLMSGLGKGVVTSSIIKILDFYHYDVLPIKFDGYLNYDCGTMNPYRHGEVFVLDDKSEVDMDFGIYERFLNKSVTGDLSITGGKLFSSVISKERKGDYLGIDIQMIPHLTDEIQHRIEDIAAKKKPDVLVIEVGGTVGDIENSYFIEAMRQFSLKHEVVFLNLTYVPNLDVVGEQKTKPTQIGFRLLLQSGIRPNFVICRSSSKLLDKTKEKIALFANLPKERIIDDSDLKTLYQLPLHLKNQNFDSLLIKDLNLKMKPIDKKKVIEWESRVNKAIKPKSEIKIAIVGKYTGLKDAYASIREALIHAGADADIGINFKWVESTYLEEHIKNSELAGVNGIIVPGGFGGRGIEGMISAIKYARENSIPYLGICLGMQLMAVEYARNVANLKNANSTEFDPKTKYNVIDIIDSQKGLDAKGGTMRLGAWECKLKGNNTIVYNSYKTLKISERHRHRYEFNNDFREKLEDAGLRITGTTTDGKLVEFIEWSKGFGIGTQAHPELKSRFEDPTPLFISFVKAAKAYAQNK
jgi:CTP synthase